MTQEEKARKYEDALERARKIHNETEFDYEKGMMEEIFPELKESEDEKIKEDLIQWINEFPDTIWRGHHKKDIIAWLENQDEKLPVGFYYVNSEGKKFYSDTFKYGDVTFHVEKQSEKKTYLD